VSAGGSRLLVDLGRLGMVAAMLANLKHKGILLSEICYGLATHSYIDQAGCAHELKERGIRLIVTLEQQHAIPVMNRRTKSVDKYRDIVTEDNLVLPASQRRTFLATLGIVGAIVHTPGHSDESISLNAMAHDQNVSSIEWTDVCATFDRHFSYITGKVYSLRHDKPMIVWCTSA
jgi:glyoxylase-like metal-dependent hydrolase (beta-lactamase superfamily II)